MNSATASAEKAAVQRKICMLGAFGVGKTSLVRRFVDSIFSESYLTTVGVKIDKKRVELPSGPVNLILWDLAGEDDIAPLRMSYLRGTAGYVLVADGTRRATLDVALSLHARVQAALGVLPFILLLNKADIRDQWTITDVDVTKLQDEAWSIRPSSALNGEGVEDGFADLAMRVVL